MAFGIFIHRSDSNYEDTPAERYQFPPQYQGRAKACEGDWIVYYEPRKVPDTRGYFAVAKVERIVPDPFTPSMHLALIVPGSYLDFANPVSFTHPDGGVIEHGLLNESGRISGRAQAAVRTLSPSDFHRIVQAGLDDDNPLLPKVGSDEHTMTSRKGCVRRQTDVPVVHHASLPGDPHLLTPAAEQAVEVLPQGGMNVHENMAMDAMPGAILHHPDVGRGTPPCPLPVVDQAQKMLPSGVRVSHLRQRPVDCDHPVEGKIDPVGVLDSVQNELGLVFRKRVSDPVMSSLRCTPAGLGRTGSFPALTRGRARRTPDFRAFSRCSSALPLRVF